jgi:hypothetical protein
MTVVEAVIATALSALAMAAVLAAFGYGTRVARAGAYQVLFTRMGRAASQRIARRIEQAKAVRVTATGVDLIAPDLRVSRVYFDTGDGDVETVSDNRLLYDPDTGATGDVEVLCRHVSPLPGEPMFGTLPSGARLCFHVGDGTNAAQGAFSRTGAGYQGVEVRMGAAPRNLQRWYTR